ncbi:MAG: (deoxy)nucleoside triphosphate pyrophosphohydrolase [Spirochaetota bacterium]
MESPRIAVAGVCLRDGKVLLGKRFDRPGIPGQWEFPGGKVEPGETLSEALAREFLEELECRISVGRRLGETDFVNKNQHYRLVAFEVTMTHPDKGPSALEHAEIGWFDPGGIDQLPIMDSDRELIRLFRAEGHLDGGSSI